MDVFTFSWTALIVPVGPPLVLTLGSIVLWIMGRFVRPGARWHALGSATGILSAIALLFWGLAAAMTVALRVQPTAPALSIPWQPFFSPGADLLWVSNGWNWYVSCLVLLLGGGGLLFSGVSGQRAEQSSVENWHGRALTLALSLNAISSALFFVSSGNLLTVTLMWVVMDLFVIARSAVVPEGPGPSPTRQFQGLSMMGALLLLIGLLPAGQGGPADLLAGGRLPHVPVILMLIACFILAGAYPLHFWLLLQRR